MVGKRPWTAKNGRKLAGNGRETAGNCWGPEGHFAEFLTNTKNLGRLSRIAEAHCGRKQKVGREHRDLQAQPCSGLDKRGRVGLHSLLGDVPATRRDLSRPAGSQKVEPQTTAILWVSLARLPGEHVRVF